MSLSAMPSALAFSATMMTMTLCCCVPVNSYTRQYYTVAVYEHARRDNFSEAAEIVQTNLAFYRKAAEVAKSKGADIIVFPEYGIFPPANRTQLKKFLEHVSDPKTTLSNPCTESESYSHQPILHALSCLAKDHSMVVVANMGDIQPCTEHAEQAEQGCPHDGVLHHNANVAFDSDGYLIGRYHKERLFFEDGMDLPRIPQDPTFETDFGKFGMFVCFDVVFEKMTRVAKQPGVDAVLLTTMWLDPTPLMTSVQLWQAWAYTNNVTFAAANIQMPGYFAVGSGIFDARRGPLAYTYNPDGLSKLVVSRVPRTEQTGDETPSESNSSITAIITPDSIANYSGDGDKVPDQCSRKILGDTQDPYLDYRCLEEDTSNYTFVRLDQSKGRADACSNGLCCSVEYEAESMSESYYLGVYNGTYDMFDRYFWCEENCFLARCDAFGDNPCATFPMRSGTRFLSVRLSANMTTEYVYPSVLASGIRLVPNADWSYESASGRATLVHSKPVELLVAGLNGRCYDKDPPYIR